jgi:coproporphyrinogen III oxidase-like Fe-S oxidoreductase
MMGTRIASGVSEDKLYKITNMHFSEIFNLQAIKQLEQQNLIIMKNGRFNLTPKGLLLHNYIVPRVLL